MSELATAIADATVAAKDSLTASALLEIGTDPIGADAAMAREWVYQSVKATREAIQQYVAGDLDMAADTQKKMEFDN